MSGHVPSIPEQQANMHHLYQNFCAQQGLVYIPPFEHLRRGDTLTVVQYSWIKHWTVVFNDLSRIIRPEDL
jgi:hypothetical protein